MLLSKDDFLRIFSKVGLEEDVNKEYERLNKNSNLIEIDILDLEEILNNLSKSILNSLSKIDIL